MAAVNGMVMCPTVATSVSDDFVPRALYGTVQCTIFQSHMMLGRPRRRLEALIGFGMDVLERLATDMSGGDSLPL